MDKDLEIKAFCKNVQFLRESNDLSYEDMAKILHISVKSLKLLEEGVLPRSIGVDVVWRISKNFGVTPSGQFRCMQDELEN